MATLDTSYGWVAGDVERIILAVGGGVSRYMINEVTIACNELGEMSIGLVSTVRALLTQYDQALALQKTINTENDAGKTLVKADVLEWKSEKGGRYEAILNERGRIVEELVKIFSFCVSISRIGPRTVTLLTRS